MGVERMRKLINRELTQLNEQLKLISVFDEAKSSQAYKEHLKIVRNPLIFTFPSLKSHISRFSSETPRKKSTMKVRELEARTSFRKRKSTRRNAN